MRNPSVSVKTGALSFHRGIALREDQFALMRYSDGSKELYDMKKDPLQLTNLAANAAHAADLEKMQKRLRDRVRQEKISIKLAPSK